MSTAKQAAANRLNAKKSTGPKTVQGKNKVSQNAVTHGLTSHRPVLDIEDTAEFRTYVNELIDQLDPTNPWEFVFAKRASCQAWRILRAQSYETLVLDNLIKSASQKDKTNPKQERDGASRPISLDFDLSSPDSTDKTNPNNTVGLDPGISTNDFRPPKTKITDYIEVDPSLFGENEDPKSLLGQALMDDFRYHWTLDKIARYETRLENSMIRCLGKFKKVRESKMMNFSSLRQYYREFQPRTQDFQDTPTSDQHKPNNVAQPPSAVIDEIDKTNPIDTPTVCHSRGGGNPDSTPDSNDKTNPIVETSAKPDDSIYSQIENDPNALPMDSFKHWKILHCAPRGEIIDEGMDIPAVPHRPNVPEKGEYVYRENWMHRILDMVEYPWEKRRKLTEPELTELVDPILMGFPNPIQFLWDFGLIKLTDGAIAKRNLHALAG